MLNLPLQKRVPPKDFALRLTTLYPYTNIYTYLIQTVALYNGTLIPRSSSIIHIYEAFFETTVSAECYLSRCLQCQYIPDLSPINT